MWDKWDVDRLKTRPASALPRYLGLGVALFNYFLCGQPHRPAFVPPYECGRSLGQVMVCGTFQSGDI